MPDDCHPWLFSKPVELSREVCFMRQTLESIRGGGASHISRRRDKYLPRFKICTRPGVLLNQFGSGWGPLTAKRLDHIRKVPALWSPIDVHWCTQPPWPIPHQSRSYTFVSFILEYTDHQTFRLGPGLLGVFLNILLYGIMITQCFFYYSRYPEYV